MIRNTVLLIHLFLCTAHISQAMEISRHRFNPSGPTLTCYQGVYSNNLALVKKSCKQGANVNHTDSYGQPLLYIACLWGNKNIVQELVNQPNINVIPQKPGDKLTPLHFLCQANRLRLAKIILKKDPQAANIPSSIGNTPLHEATLNFYPRCIKLLIKHEANPTITNHCNETPLFLLFNSMDRNIFDAFIKKYRKTAKKLILTTDANNNNQFHLCTKVQLPQMNRFEEYLSFLTSYGLDIQSRNKDNKTAGDSVYEAYNTLHAQYITETRIKESFQLRRNLRHQERLLHTFLRFTLPALQATLLTTVLKQISSEGLELPKELQSYIAYLYYALYYALHTETLIAQKYTNDDNYYKYRETVKNKIKLELITKPEPHLLWRKS